MPKHFKHNKDEFNVTLKEFDTYLTKYCDIMGISRVGDHYELVILGDCQGRVTDDKIAHLGIKFKYPQDIDDFIVSISNLVNVPPPSTSFLQFCKMLKTSNN